MTKKERGRYDSVVRVTQERLEMCKKALESDNSCIMDCYYRTVISELESRLDALHFLAFGTFE